jgi:hypothetical protein
MGDTGTYPRRTLTALTLAVLLVHLLLLRQSTLTIGLSQPNITRNFVTRTLTPPPPATTPQEAPAPPPKARPPANTVRITTPSDTQAEPPAPAASVPPPPTEPLAKAPEPSASSPQEIPTEPEQLSISTRAPQEADANFTADALPGSIKLQYKVDANKFPYSANAELLWQQDGETYQAQLEISSFGLKRSQSSRGTLTKQGLAPLRFADKFRGEVAAHFERDKGKISFSANTPDVPLQADAQDRLSIFIQLAAIIAGHPQQFTPGTSISMQTVGPRDADTWMFVVDSSETLILPGGMQSSLKLTRKPRQAYDQKVELWLAPSLGYLPARIRVTEANGDFIDQQWLSTQTQFSTPVP